MPIYLQKSRLQSPRFGEMECRDCSRSLKCGGAPYLYYRIDCVIMGNIGSTALLLFCVRKRRACGIRRERGNTMKRTVTVLSLVLVLILTIGLVGCGESEKKQEAIDKHTEVALAFNGVATLINENKEWIDSDTLDVYRQMSDLLNQYTEILQGDAELEDAKYDEMIAWFDQVLTWVNETKTYIETELISG